MNFADYLFGERKAEEVDQYEPPEDGGRPASDAVLLDLATQGEVIRDVPESTIRILVDDPALTMTWTRYVEGVDGPSPHIHREHADAFFVLSGQLVFLVGPELERVEAGPEHVRPGAARGGPHVPQRGPRRGDLAEFPRTLRGFCRVPPQSGHRWDSFDAPADGGRPVSEALVQHVHPA